MSLWGFDLGGTKIEGIVIPDARRLETAARIRIDTEAQGGYERILDRIDLLVDKLANATGERPRRLGIGTPGSQNPGTGLMRNCNTTCLNGMPLHRDLEKKTGLEVWIANDANCFALAEAKWGAGRGFETVFGVILGTGVGGGLVVGGKALDGANGIAGEWGHNVLDPKGPPCYCGRRGCIETFLSGPANERRYSERTGVKRSLKEIAARTDTDEHARQLIEELCRDFGRAIAYVVNIFDPHAIILGGGVGQVEALYSLGVEETRRHVFSDSFETPFLKPKLGDSAGVFGAALLVQEGH